MANRELSNLHYVTGEVAAGRGAVPRVGAGLSMRDRLGSWKVRWRWGRDRYTVPPGLYALGSPEESSEVLVTANYKLTFDFLRRELPGRDFWILVLDTKGINVWCAAGKGTFGTEELVKRIEGSGLPDIVAHKRLILPQLGAPGVAAHRVKKESGFKVIYGPIRSSDIPAFIDAGLKATPAMRRKTFPIGERVVLIPVDLVGAFRIGLPVMAAFFFLSGLGGPGDYWDNTSYAGILAVTALAAAMLGGSALVPILLPWLPGRAFSLKGLWAGLICVAAVLLIMGNGLSGWTQRLETVSWILMAGAVASFIGMNFTGASTYTSLSGVRKEMRIAVPLQIGSAAIGLICWIGSRLTA